MHSELVEKILDQLENRIIQGMLEEVEMSASVMEIIRRVLQTNGRLVADIEAARNSQEMGGLDEDELPFPQETIH